MVFVFDAVNGVVGYRGTVPQMSADATRLLVRQLRCSCAACPA